MGGEYHAVRAVAPLGEYRLLLTFDNGQRRVFDVKPYLGSGLFAALEAPGLFNSVRLSFDTIEWSNGADLCPEVLYTQSVKVEDPETVSP